MTRTMYTITLLALCAGLGIASPAKGQRPHAHMEAERGAAPANDDPCNAIELTVITGCMFPVYSTEFATITGDVPDALCDGGPYTSDVWFTAVVPPNGELIIDTDDGTLVDAGLAVYTGTCGSLTPVPFQNGGCSISGSANGAAMPINMINGIPAGTTLYIRFWRQAGSDGSFQICARDPAIPAGCSYRLWMSDSWGDGWDAGYLTLCINSECTDHTVYGSVAYITFVAQPGDAVSLSYTPAGEDQNEVAYQLTASNGAPLYLSTIPPTPGSNFSLVVDALCNEPPPPISDCVGAMLLCGDEIITLTPSNFGSTQDLDASNHGCLQTNERQGAWFRFTTNATGTIAFDINIGAGMDYDFGVWGPFDGAVPCPPQGPPIRCNWSATAGPTGLNYTATNLSNGAGGPSYSRYIDALPNETYVLYVDNYSQNGLSFDLIWDNQPSDLIACITTSVVEDELPQLDLRPNPASDRLMITSPFSEGNVQVEVMDASGRLVVRHSAASVGPITLNIDRLSPGLHLVRMMDRRGRVATARFMKE